MSRTETLDNTKMTNGPITRILLSFAGPVLLGQLLQQLYNIADAAIVGQFLSSKALAAVGATSSLTYIVCYFCIGSCIGISVPVSQAFGAGKNTDLRKYFINGVYFALAIAVIMTAVTASMSGLFLTWLKTPENIFKDAHVYLVIIFLGLPLTVLYNFCFGILMAFGDSKKSTMFMAVSTVINIFLDLFLVVVVKWGVAGAAVATIFSQGIAGVLSAVYIFKKYKLLFPVNADERKFHPYYMKNIIKMCMPMGLQYSITAIGTMMVQSALNMLGSYAVAAFTAGSKIEQIFTQAYVAQGTASATYNAQNIGAGKLERVREGFRASHFIGIVYSVVVGGFLFFAGKYFAYLFISDNIKEVLPMVAIYVKCVALFFIPLYFVNVLRNGIQGMGYGLLPMMAGVAELAGRGITATVAAGKSSYIGTCLASPVAWIFASVLLWVMYFYVMKDMARKLYGTNKL